MIWGGHNSVPSTSCLIMILGCVTHSSALMQTPPKSISLYVPHSPDPHFPLTTSCFLLQVAPGAKFRISQLKSSPASAQHHPHHCNQNHLFFFSNLLFLRNSAIPPVLCEYQQVPVWPLPEEQGIKNKTNFKKLTLAILDDPKLNQSLQMMNLLHFTCINVNECEFRIFRGNH